MIVVVGMAFEARIAAGAGLRVICSGGDSEKLATSLQRAITSGCQGLISFGVAGGLAPHLRTGTCVVGSEILTGEDSLPTDPQWSQTLLRTIPAIHGPILGSPTAVTEPAAKRALYEKTGAVAVDMESHVVARIAADHGMPMATLRVITDSAKRAVPQSALVGMRPDGSADVGAVVRRLLRNPGELPALLRTALDVRTARNELLRSSQVLGPGLGLLNLS